MGGECPKVIYEVGGRSMVNWVVQACLNSGVSRCVVVVGFGGEQVQQAVGNQPQFAFVEQLKQLGTGHATQMAQPLYDGREPKDVLVLPGDAPLIQPQTLARLIQTHRTANAVATLTSSMMDNPTGYGRVIRGQDGLFEAIVEEKDATDEQRTVSEINTGYYCFRSDRLFECLTRVSNTNAQGEYYLTDVPGLLKREGEKIAILDGVAPQEIMGVNNPQQLAEVDKIIRSREGISSNGDVSKESA